MTSFHHRSITTETLDWRGILIQVRFEPQRFVDHLQIETLDPQRAPLPITETGYRSHFIAKGAVEDVGSPADYVLGWLEATCKTKGWHAIEERVRQYQLL